MQKVVITADLGHFRAYRITEDSLERRSPQIELIEAFDTILGKQKMNERYTDSPGTFKKGGGINGPGGFGERHGIEAEKEKRLVQMAADNIMLLLERENLPIWHLCASTSINNSLLNCLSLHVKKGLNSIVKADLTRVTKQEILSRFTS